MEKWRALLFPSRTVGLCLAMLLGGLFSLWLGKELCWDLAYYHFYNPYAFLNGRQSIDYWPVSFIHQFLNPAIDLFPYFLITHTTPLLTEFTLGALHGINGWLLFLITRRFVTGPHAIAISLVITLLGLYGPTVLPGMGSFQNDNLISVFVLAFVFLQLRFLQQPFIFSRHHSLALFFAGTLLGLAVGLKLTAGIFVLAACFTTLLLPIQLNVRAKLFVIVNAGVLCGFLVTAGYWMGLMWEQHHNPLFPFFNNIFHSPDFNTIAWRDTRFLPHGVWQTLFYPFYFSFTGSTADLPDRDIRFLMVYLLLVVAAFTFVKQTIKKQTPTLNLPVYWFSFFFVSAYIVWQAYFSIARYIAPLEMLAPLFIYLLLTYAIENRVLRFALLIVIYQSILFFMQPTPMVRATSFGTHYFNVQLPPLVKAAPHATVLIAYPAYVMNPNPRPQSYLIPFFPNAWRFIGVPFSNENYVEDTTTREKIRAHLRLSNDPIFLLTSDRNMPALYVAAQTFALYPAGPCEPIHSDRQVISNQGVLLCPVAFKQTHEEARKHELNPHNE